MARVQILPFGLDDAPSGISTQYMSVTGQGEVATWTTTESEVRMVVPTAGVFTNLVLKGDTSPGASKQYTITLRVNGANTALAAVLSGTNTSTYSLARVSVAAGDVVTFSSVPSGSPGAVQFHGSIDFEPTNPAVCILMGGTGDVSLGLAAGYLAPHALANRSAGEDQVWMITPNARGGQFGTISNMYVGLDTAPGGVTARNFELYLNSAATGDIVTISGTNTAGNAGTSTSISDGDTLSVYTYVTGSPSGGKAYFGLEITTDAVGDYLIPGVSGGAMSTSSAAYEYNFSSTGNAAWRAAKAERPNGVGRWHHRVLGLGLKLTRAPNTGGGSGKAYELYLENPSAGGTRAYVLDAATYDLGEMCWGLKRFNAINVRSLAFGTPSVVDGSWVMHMRYLPGRNQ